MLRRNFGVNSLIMRTREIEPRVPLTQTDSSAGRKRSVFNPAFGGLLAALVAGLFAESVSQSYPVVAFRAWWREALMATFWFVMAVIGVVRDLNQTSR